ncbi:MAG: YqaE/Pmp3 family membrane protein [Spirochaetales bacterium]|nr:YqaE/Pmp3 family membrane protein [Spirochaetales bacterium]
MAKGKGADLLLIILAILLPFVAVFLKKGVGKDLLINIILCIFFYIPGIIHALWVVLK